MEQVVGRLVIVNNNRELEYHGTGIPVRVVGSGMTSHQGLGKVLTNENYDAFGDDVIKKTGGSENQKF